MGRAGYDQRGLIAFMENLRGGTPEFFSSHPDPDNRVNRLRTMYEESHQADATYGTNPQIYRSRVNGP